MFKLLSVLLLALASAQAFATQPFYCSGCGNPYSDAGGRRMLTMLTT